MRRTIVMLVAVTMIMGIFAPVLGLANVNAAPNNEVIQGNEHATHIIAQWHQVGHDEYGDPMPLVNSPRTGMCAYDGPAEPPY